MLSKELRKLYRPFWIRVLMKWAKVRLKYRHCFESHHHTLPHELIVTLTSYPARFDSLHLTLMCLLSQSVKPDRVVLWVAHQDQKQLPKLVLELQDYGLEIRTTEDTRSYKKLIPSLETFPGAGFVIVDDDLYYPRNLLANLLKSAQRFPDCVIAGRVHKVRYHQNGNILPYKQWDWNSRSEQSQDNFYTGCGGAFFPPKAFDQEVLNQENFLKLAPFADDVWFNWMLKRNGTSLIALKTPFTFWDWPSSQKVSLHAKNVSKEGNDQQIKAMIEHYGQLYQRDEPKNV